MDLAKVKEDVKRKPQLVIDRVTRQTLDEIDGHQHGMSESTRTDGTGARHATTGSMKEMKGTVDDPGETTAGAKDIRVIVIHPSDMVDAVDAANKDADDPMDAEMTGGGITVVLAAVVQGQRGRLAIGWTPTDLE